VSATDPISLPRPQRHKLDQSKLTPLTPETFAIWKKTRLSKKEAEEGAIQGAKGLAAASGRTNGMSGRDLFTFQAHLLENSDDEDDGEDDFDVHLARVRAEAKERSEEIERNRQMDR